MTLGELHDSLTAAGLPIKGLSRHEGGEVAIAWANEPTTQQLTQAQTVVNAADWTPRRGKDTAALVSEILTFIDVPAGQPAWVKRLAKVAALALAASMRTDPKLARRVGEAIDGDEPIGTIEVSVPRPPA